ncbi:MAG: recombination protein O N-terminal domain-containing protein [Patescibacteria group bacterium]
MSVREVTARGIVVARRSAGEGSVRISLYTDSLGLVSALAKSAREERSKLRPHLQVGTTGVFTLVKGRDVWRIIGATNTENSYFSLSGKSDAQEASARIIAVVRQFIRGEGSDPYLFSALFGFFTALPPMDQEYVLEAECVTVFRVLSALGYVREELATQAFLDIAYDIGTLKAVRESRPTLVRRINEAISESGL